MSARDRADPSVFATQWPDPRTTPITAKRAYVEVLAVFAAFFGMGVINALLVLTHQFPAQSSVRWGVAISDAFEQIAVAGLAIAVPILLVRRRGLSHRDLGLVAPPGPHHGLVTGLRMATWSFLATLTWAITVGALPHPHLPEPPKTVPDLVVSLAHSLQAGPMEEIIVVAFTVVTLEQARRPRLEIILVALCLRESFHLYYGVAAIGVVLWAGMNLWLFLRFRSIVPVIAFHCYWDVQQSFGQFNTHVGGLFVLGLLAMSFAAVIGYVVTPPSFSPKGTYRFTKRSRS